MTTAPASKALQVAVALFYMAISFAMAFANKAVLRLGFEHPLALLCVQLAFTLASMLALRSLGIIDFPFLSLALTLRLSRLSVLYALNVALSLSALASLNIPMHGALKRLTLVAALVGEKLVLHQHHPPAIHVAVALIALGALVAGAGDLTFSPIGYIYALSSCVVQAAFLTLLKKAHAADNIPSLSLVFYNALLAFPFVLVASLFTGDLTALVALPAEPREIILAVSAAVVAGALLNYATFLCTTVTSPLTLTVAGQTKAIAQTLVGLVAFGGVPLNPLNLLGLAMNSAGGTYYAYVKAVGNDDKERTKGDSLV